VPARVVDELVKELLGVELRWRERTGYVVQKVRSGSGAERVGVQPGDLLLGVNGRTLDDPASLRRSVLELRGHSQALIVVQRGGGRYHVTLPLV
jgi:serine protease Do